MNLFARCACAIIIAMIAILVFCTIVASYTVKVSVSEDIESEIKSVNKSWGNNFIALDYDIFNSGSTGYRLRLRVDIYNITNGTDSTGKALPVATIWTQELPLQPGARNTSTIYWHGGRGNFTVRVTAYRAQEITDVGNISFALDDSAEPESIFTIEKVRTYDNEIRLKIRISKDASGVIIYPVDYPAGWLIEQVNFGAIKSGESRWVSIRYEPALFSERTVVFAIAGNGGKYYSEQAAGLKMESGISKYLHLLTDSFF